MHYIYALYILFTNLYLRNKNNLRKGIMNKIIYFIVGTFSLVYLFQSLDKTCKRKSFFDKIKMPLLTSSIIGILSAHLLDENMGCGPTFSFLLPFRSKPSINGQDIFTDLGNF